MCVNECECDYISYFLPQQMESRACFLASLELDTVILIT